MTKTGATVHVEIKEGTGYTIGENGSASVQVIDSDKKDEVTLPPLENPRPLRFR